MGVNVDGAVQDPILREHLRAYGNSLEQYCCDRICTRVPVMDKKGNFFEEAGGFSAAFPEMDYYRAMDGDYPSIDIRFTEQTGWNLKDFGVGTNIDRKAASYLAGSGTRIDLRKRKGRRLVHTALIRREALCQALVQNQVAHAARSTTLGVADQLDNPASALAAQVKDWLLAHRDAKGVRANAVAMPDDVALAIAHHPEAAEHWSRTTQAIAGRVIDSQDEDTLADVIARIFMVPRKNVFICSARRNTAAPGLAEVLARVWGKHITLFNRVDSLTEGDPNGAFARYQYIGDPDGQFEGDEATVRLWQKSPLVERMTLSWDEQFMHLDVNQSYMVIDAIS